MKSPIEMPKFGLAIIVLLGLVPVAQAQFNVGFDFRATESFVSGDHSTDCNNTTTQTKCEIAVSGTYPTSMTVNGSSFNAGYNLAPDNTADRDSGIDIRLAGIAYVSNAGASSYQVDLSAPGDYCFTLALGDAGGLPHPQKMIVDDDTTPLLTVQGTTIPGHFLDATQTDYDAATWAGSQTGVTLTFATTILQVKWGNATGGLDFSTLAFFGIAEGACAAPPPSTSVRHRVIQ